MLRNGHRPACELILLHRQPCRFEERQVFQNRPTNPKARDWSGGSGKLVSLRSGRAVTRRPNVKPLTAFFHVTLTFGRPLVHSIYFSKLPVKPHSTQKESSLRRDVFRNASQHGSKSSVGPKSTHATSSKNHVTTHADSCLLCPRSKIQNPNPATSGFPEAGVRRHDRDHERARCLSQSPELRTWLGSVGEAGASRTLTLRRFDENSPLESTSTPTPTTGHTYIPPITAPIPPRRRRPIL